MTIRDPALQRGMMGTDKRSVKGRAGQSKSKALHEEMTFEVELMQNLNVLKNAKGDTGEAREESVSGGCLLTLQSLQVRSYGVCRELSISRISGIRPLSTNC